MMSLEQKLTVKEVAQELGVHERSVHRWISQKELPTVGYDIHGRHLILRSDLEKFVERKTREGRRPPKTKPE